MHLSRFVSDDILVATDGSDPATAAVEGGVELAADVDPIVVGKNGHSGPKGGRLGRITDRVALSAESSVPIAGS